jgi:hypothetical protein
MGFDLATALLHRMMVVVTRTRMPAIAAVMSAASASEGYS